MTNHVSYSSSPSFSFHGLAIRELSPQDHAALSVAEVKVPPGATHPTARSTKSDKVYVGLEGAITFTTRGESLQLTPMDVLLIPVASWFTYTNHTRVEGRVLVIHTPPFDMAHEELVQ